MTSPSLRLIARAERLARRADEAAFLADMPRELLNFHDEHPTRIVRVGRFTPGGEGTYASAAVLLRRSNRSGIEYTTHDLIRFDDRDDDPEVWVCANGHYFPSDDPATSFARASADLLVRSHLVEDIVRRVVAHLDDAGDLRSWVNPDETVRDVVAALLAP
jgi:hypothetical protein